MAREREAAERVLVAGEAAGDAPAERLCCGWGGERRALAPTAYFFFSCCAIRASSACSSTVATSPSGTCPRNRSCDWRSLSHSWPETLTFSRYRSADSGCGWCWARRGVGATTGAPRSARACGVSARGDGCVGTGSGFAAGAVCCTSGGTGNEGAAMDCSDRALEATEGRAAVGSFRTLVATSGLGKRSATSRSICRFPSPDAASSNAW